MVQHTILSTEIERGGAPVGELTPLRRAPRKRRMVEPVAGVPAIIRSKVQSPVVRTTTLERPRLLAWLERHDAERVRFVTAEAGYGKTTLLADFARRSRARTLWYRLDTSDGDWLTIISYLVAAVREIVPDFGVSTMALLIQASTMGTTREVALSTFLAELGALGDEPTILIVDDVHLVQSQEDVQVVLERLFERAPDAMSFILAGRRRPDLRLGRLAAQGGVAALTTNDLRFSLRETEDLFEESYSLRLDDDVVTAIDARTEGWSASLQLVCSSIRTCDPHQVRAFVNDLSGTTEPIYDFLAEEVLGRQPPVMQRVLMHASLLDRIVPAFVLAALAVSPDSPGADTVVDCLEAADDQGLMSRSAATSSSRRFHPLLASFLVRQLELHSSPTDIRAMHLRIGQAAEPGDWLTSAHHYIEAGHASEAMRVLGESTLRTLGTGTWGPATELIARMPEIEPPLAVQVIRARALVAAGRPDDAIALLASLVPDPASPYELGLHRLASAIAYHYGGQARELERVLGDILSDPTMPTQVSGIATAWSMIINASGGGPLSPVRQELLGLARRQSKEGLHYFSAVSYHNAMVVALAEGRFEMAIDLGDEALQEFGKLAGAPPEVASTRAAISLAAWENHNIVRALEEGNDASTRPEASMDALAYCAWMAIAAEQTDRAKGLLGRMMRPNVVGAQELGVAPSVRYTRGPALLAEGKTGDAASLVDAAIEISTEPDAIVRKMAMQALVPVNRSRSETQRIVERALVVADSQGSHRWIPWLELLGAVSSEEPTEIRRCVVQAASLTPLSFLSIADAVGDILHALDPAVPELESSMAAYPNRWLPILRRALDSPHLPNASAAATYLCKYGSKDDVPRLAAYERHRLRYPRDRTLARRLARRLTPTLQIHDLGQIAYEAGTREVRVSQTRRKAAALLMFLASRPRQSATREQVLEELWPDLNPGAAANSLHQTVYFLRRDIEPWYADGISADYVAVESEMVYLDTDLVQVDSAAFLRQSAEILASDNIAERGSVLLRQYAGSFAPEFEYEEWSMAWRDRVHSTFLQLVQATSEALLACGSARQAADVLGRALVVDPNASELEVGLVRALLKLGARAAAAEQYSHYAQAYRRDYGTEPPSMDDIASGLGDLA